MKCPNCEIPLMMTERKGIEVDFCINCRGIWLDRGELDKLIEMSMEERDATPLPKPAKEEYRPARSDRSKQYVEKRDRKKYKDKDYYKSKYKKSTLARIIDFLD